jgi:hypothetical protein
VWTIERGVYGDLPWGGGPTELVRIWRFHPPPWKLIVELPIDCLSVVEDLVASHNEEVEAAGETPQLGIVPRKVIAQWLRRALLARPRPQSSLDLRWIENHIQWLEDRDRPMPTGVHAATVRLERALRSIGQKHEEIKTDPAWTDDQKHDILRYYEGHAPYIRSALENLRGTKRRKKV